MKNFLLITVVLFTISSNVFCSWNNNNDQQIVDIDSTVSDSVEYELLITELGYDTYLVSQPPMEFYSESYYKHWNHLYVIEWNNRFRTGPRQEIYENEIDYSYYTEYGLELEYRLYYFFKFFENKYNVTLLKRVK